jgi:signal transduction histidine kinase/CheY-like chemotaxis protein
MSGVAERVLIYAPSGRDAVLAAQVLDQAGFAALACARLDEFTAALDAGAGAGILTEEALAPACRQGLREVLDRQPLWSDLPLIVCAKRPETLQGRHRLATLAAEMGNTTLLERPIHPEALIGSVRSALRARRRQHQARELLQGLETAIRQREQFLATLSHELRNPLGAIRSAIQLLRSRLAAGGSAERPVAVIERQSRHLVRLVDDLLDVARVTTGKVVLQRQPVDLRTIAENICQQLGATAEANGLRLDCQPGTEPLVVHGDPVRLDQIFTNVLTNAFKYTPRGGSVSLTLERAEDVARVRVADSGVGMSPETLLSIFDLFSQADRSLDRAQGGMGIGLTLVRSLAELHGGTASASSPGLGRGSEFVITLPLRSDEGPPPAVVDEEPSPRRRHILIVEDSPDNREMLQALLEYEGHQVEVATNGLEAVEAAARSRPEVALIDIGLPGIDGYEVARRMRAGLGREIVLVALTGYGRPEDRQRSVEAGFDTHLTKPPDLAELNAVLARGS